jgi:hypothetical protein
MKLAVWAPGHTQAVLKHGNVLLSGAPGSGKSQLLREVLIPALLSSGAEVLVIDHDDVLSAKPSSQARTPLRRLVIGSADAAAHAGSLLKSSCLVTFDCPRIQRDGMCELLLQSLHGELSKRPLPTGRKRVLVLDIPQATGAMPTLDLMIRDAGRFGFSLVATCQSPSSLDESTLAAFHCHIGFYHFFKRCLKRMAQQLLQTAGAASGYDTEKPAPVNTYGQPMTTPVSRLAGGLAQLKVGECILGIPDCKLEKLKPRG